MVFAFPALAFASVEITHVTYDPPGSDSGREWVEITNKGASEVSLEGFKFLEGGVKHKLTLAQGSWTLTPGASAAIVTDPSTFLTDHSGFSKSIYKSPFSLSNTGETITLLNAKGEVENTMSYIAAPTPPKPTATKTTTSKTSPKTSSASKTQAAALAETGTGSFITESTGKGKTPSLLIWYAGLGAVISMGVLGVILARPFSQKELETKGNNLEFNIE